MNNFEGHIKCEDGSEETIVVSSNDSQSLNMHGTYVLANRSFKKTNNIANKFKNSIIGSDIGVKSRGFSSVAILASIIALGTLTIMYFSWRF